MPFILTDYRKLHGLEIALSNTLITDLFCLNKRMVIFSKTEKKKLVLKQTREGPYIYGVYMEGNEGS